MLGTSHRDDSCLEEERICNGEVRSHRRGSREGSKCSSEKRSRLAETNLGRIYKMAAVGRFYRIVEKSDSVGAKILDPATHSDALMICGLVMPCLLQVSQTRHCCFHRFRECHVVFGLKPFWTFETITMDHAQTVHR